MLTIDAKALLDLPRPLSSILPVTTTLTSGDTLGNRSSGYRHGRSNGVAARGFGSVGHIQEST